MEKTYNQKLIEHIETATAEGRAEHKNANTLNYIFITEPDGWISIIEYIDGRYIAKLQACDQQKAYEYITLREPLNIQVNIF